jgi:hydroxymethylpyrimidine/phosphomethylpyrimidine kinase
MTPKPKAPSHAHRRNPRGETAPSPPAVALTIAGSDPSGGAGLQADLKTFQVQGVYGMSVLTVATDCETASGVEKVHALPPSFVIRQLRRVMADIPPDAVKTGMLYSAAIIRRVAAHLRSDPPSWLVVDPVMTTRSGDALLPEAAEAALRSRLIPIADVVTPSLPEAERLLGQPMDTRADVEAAARALTANGPAAAVITGGHRDGPAADCAAVNGTVIWLEAARREVCMHGAGDTFSAALASRLALGASLEAAIRDAKDVVTTAIRTASDLGSGTTPPGHAHLAGSNPGRPRPAV